MQVAVYSDGRALEYDESARGFSISGAGLTGDQVAAYDRAGQLAWSSPETRDWFHRTFSAQATAAAVPPTRKGKPILLVVVALAVLGVCGACSFFFILGSDGDSPTVDSPAPAGAAQGDAASSQTPAVGQPVSTAEFEITVTAVAVRDSVGGEYFSSTPAEGGEYVTVQWKYKNISSEPIGMFSQPLLYLVDPNGIEYSSDVGASGSFATELDLTQKLVSDLNPGITVTDAAVFEVAKGAFVPGQWTLRVKADDDVVIGTN